jgi:guanylate kinase
LKKLENRCRTLSKSKGKIIVVSAPSGSGKTTIIKSILRSFPNIVFSVSATTRSKRDNEIEDVDYFFLSKEEFEKKIENNEFVEWEKVYDYYYGTLKSSIEANINSGKSILLELDVNGALSMKKIYPDSALIYILPPSYEEIMKRLKNRNTETKKDLKKRLERAKLELRFKDKFDYFIENENLNKAIEDTKRLINNIIKEKVNGNRTC